MSIQQDDLDLLNALTAGLPDAVSYPSHPPEIPVPVRPLVVLSLAFPLYVGSQHRLPDV